MIPIRESPSDVSNGVIAVRINFLLSTGEQRMDMSEYVATISSKRIHKYLILSLQNQELSLPVIGISEVIV